MADETKDLLRSVTAAVAAARHRLHEVESERTADLDEQLQLATSLSRSRQLSAELSDVAGEALRNQHSEASTVTAAISGRRAVLDQVTEDLEALVERLGQV